MKTGEPSRARTCDPLIKSAFTDTPAGYGSYDLLTFVQVAAAGEFHLLPPIISSLSVFLSQVCLKRLSVPPAATGFFVLRSDAFLELSFAAVIYRCDVAAVKEKRPIVIQRNLAALLNNISITPLNKLS